MKRFFKFFWLISILLYLVALLLIYAFLPEQVGVHANEWGMPDEFIERSIFFYSSLVVFLLANGLLYSLYKLLLITRRTVQTEQSLVLRQALAGWFLGFAGALNLLFIMVMAFFALLNRQGTSRFDVYALLVYGGPLLIGLMLALLVYILMKYRR